MGLFDSVHAKTPTGIFTPQSPTQAYGLLAGAIPGGMGAPPARSTPDFLRAYSQMPWLRAVAMRIATAVASSEWQAFVVKGKDTGKARSGGIVTRLQKADDKRARMLLRKEVQQAPDLDLVQVLDNPLLTVLREANSFQTGLAMRKLTQIHLDLVGDAFWLKERDGQGTVVGVWPVPPHWIMATPTPSFRFFRVSFRAWRGLIPDTEWVWFSDDDPLNPYGRGTGIAMALGDELETDEYAARHTKAFFYNQARPDMLIWPKSGNMSPQNTKRLEEDWLANSQGFFRAFKPYFMSREVEVKEFSQNLRALQFVQLREFERDTILQVYGVPPEILGVLEHSNRATITAADYLMARYVVEPRLEFLRSVLQERFVPEFDERIIVDYVSPVQADDDLKLQVATVAPWAPSINEWRAMAGLPALEDEEAGARHMIPNTSKPGTLLPEDDPEPVVAPVPQPGQPGAEQSQNPGGQVPPQPAGGDADSEPKKAALAAADAGDFVLALALRKATSLDIAALPYAAQAAARQEPGLARSLVKVWRAHMETVSLAALQQALGAPGTLGDVVDVLAPETLGRALEKALEPQLGLGFMRGAEVGARALRRHGVAVRGGAVLAKGWVTCWQCRGTGVRHDERCYGCDGKGQRWVREEEKAGGKQSALAVDLNAVNPAAIAWAREHAGDLVDAPAEVREEVRELIARSLEGGMSDRELAQLLREAVGLSSQQAAAVLNFALKLSAQNVAEATRAARLARYADAQRQARALTIARTELMGALNGGQQALWDQAVAQGVIHARQFDKVWIVTDDDALDTEICEPMAEEQVAINDVFSSGDPYPPAHPNCRCTIGLVPAE